MGRKFERTAAIFLVLVFHAVGVVIAVGLSRYRVAIAVDHPIVVLFLASRHPEPPARRAFDGHVQGIMPLPAPEPLPLIVPPLTIQDGDNGGAVDWTAEAARQAEASATAVASESKTAPNSPKPDGAGWFPPPRHYKGEQVPGVGGETMVFINEHCYQVTSVFKSASNASNNGMGLQTYCVGDSNEPRGDLFKELAAYKKHHPDK